MIVPDPLRVRHRRATDRIRALESRLDHQGRYLRLWSQDNAMGFLRVTDAAELIGYSRPTLQKLIDRGLVREIALFPENPNAPRFVSVSDLLRLPAVALRLTTDGEVVRRRARPWEE